MEKQIIKEPGNGVIYPDGWIDGNPGFSWPKFP